MFDFEELMNVWDGVFFKNIFVCFNFYVFYIFFLEFFFVIIIFLGGFDIKKYIWIFYFLVKVVIIVL